MLNFQALYLAMKDFASKQAIAIDATPAITSARPICEVMNSAMYALHAGRQAERSETSCRRVVRCTIVSICKDSCGVDGVVFLSSRFQLSSEGPHKIYKI